MVISDFKVLERLLHPIKMGNLYFFRPLTGFSFDSRKVKPGAVFVAVKGTYKDGHHFIRSAVNRGAGLVVTQKPLPPGLKVPFFMVADTMQALHTLAGFVRKRKNPFVYAVTGSVGKTTVKEMITFLLEGEETVCQNHKTENNIFGVAKTLFSLRNEKSVVLELGTNSPGEIAALSKAVAPDIGVITFIKPVHLQGFKTMDRIFAEKSSIFEGNQLMKAVLNHDDLYLKRIAGKGTIYWYGFSKGCHLSARRLKHNDQVTSLLVQHQLRLQLTTPFSGFAYNALAAIAAVHCAGYPLKPLVEKLNHFDRFPEQRMQQQNVKGYAVINDAYNANPYSVSKGLQMLARYPHKKVAILGDMLELGEQSPYYHRLLAKDIIAGSFTYCVTIGRDTIYLQQRLRAMGYRGGVHCATHAQAASFIKRKVAKKSLLFLKGSRSMEIEKVLLHL